jgi:hypothetical protein
MGGAGSGGELRRRAAAGAGGAELAQPPAGALAFSPTDICMGDVLRHITERSGPQNCR